MNLKKSLLITLDFPPRFGGVSSYYYNIAKNLPGDKIIVLAPAVPQTENFDANQNFTILRSKILTQITQTKGGILNFKSKLKWLALTKEIKQIVKNHQIEILLVGQVLPLGNIALMLRKHLPYIFFSHGMDITVPAKITRKKLLLKKIIKNAKAIVCNSYFTRHELYLLGADREKIIVLNPCPNISAEHINEQKIENFLKQNELKDKKIILTVGRLVKRKGHDQVIKALPEIINKIPQACYVIAGDGPNLNDLIKLVSEKKLGQYVKFIKDVPQEVLPILYQTCEVMAMPSRQLSNGDVEGFGIVYLEANLFGKPVIGGKSGGVPEAIVHEKTGLLVPPLDVTSLAEAIISLMINPAYAHQLGLQGLDRVHEEFSWREQTNKLFKIL